MNNRKARNRIQITPCKQRRNYPLLQVITLFARALSIPLLVVFLANLRFSEMQANAYLRLSIGAANPFA